LVDHAFDIRAYSWLAVWYCSFTVYEVVVKHMCDTVALDNWTRVIYTNAMAGILLALALPFARQEREIVAAVAWNNATVSTMLASCLIGIGVSHSAYVMRSACSATLSAVVGILCKVLTVLINIVVWDKHASLAELGFLAIGLLSGALYQQAPIRKEANNSTSDPEREAILSQQARVDTEQKIEMLQQHKGGITSSPSSCKRDLTAR